MATPLMPYNIVYLEGKSPSDIQSQLDKLRIPYAILGAYGLNGKHYLVIGTVEKLVIKNK